jgi:hypothetical protein
MEARLKTREWFYDTPGHNTYDIEEHVRRSFWMYGFGRAWFRCTRAEPPYRCQGWWRGQELAFEWVPRRWLKVYLQSFDKSIVDGFSAVVGMKPFVRYNQGNGENPSVIVEWRTTGLAQRFRELTEREDVRELERLK